MPRSKCADEPDNNESLESESRANGASVDIRSVAIWIDADWVDEHRARGDAAADDFVAHGAADDDD